VPVEISEASSEADYGEFGQLITVYEAWLHARYASVPQLIDEVREHQDLDAELADLPHKYGPPRGVTLLARRDGRLAGGGAYRDLGDGACEMKRLFVLEAAQGRGVGRDLCVRLIEHATRAGYTAMRLDTGFLNDEAIALYTDLGYTERDTYSDYPPRIAVHLRFFEKPLTPAAG
jgi:GNAT superfamily N-acetyltransferase